MLGSNRQKQWVLERPFPRPTSSFLIILNLNSYENDSTELTFCHFCYLGAAALDLYRTK